MKLEKVIAVRTAKTVYRDGNRAVNHLRLGYGRDFHRAVYLHAVIAYIIHFAVAVCLNLYHIRGILCFLLPICCFWWCNINFRRIPSSKSSQR